MIKLTSSFTLSLSLAAAPLFSLQVSVGVSAFSAMFPDQQSGKRLTPSAVEGVRIELPDFDVLFQNIREVSPLACMVLDQDEITDGFAAADEKYKSPLKWKTMESNKGKTVHRIEKIDNYRDLGCPIMRYRASIEGPCLGMKFVRYVMDFEERARYDPQIEELYERYPAYDVAAANIMMNFKYGDCKMLGVGYTKTKSYLVIDGREQLTLCGLQKFTNGGWIIWGVELDERHDTLFPDCERRTRAKTHLFSTTLMPTGAGSFDVEYVLQLDCGGSMPQFLTTPVFVETVKSMFEQVKKDFADKEITDAWAKREDDEGDSMLTDGFGLLMTP